MKTRVLAITGMALFLGVSALPAAAAPVFQGNGEAPFMLAARDEDQAGREEVRDKRKSAKRPARKAEKQEREQEAPGYGYGYERRNSPPEQPDPRFDRR